MKRIQTLSDLEKVVEEYGFLPYKGNEKESLFSLSGLTDNVWFDGSETDPWGWRVEIAEKKNQAYGKFFKNKTGFVSRTCIPAFIAVRRNNRNAAELYRDGQLSRRARQVWDCFEQCAEWTFQELKHQAGFDGQSREFEAALTELQGLFLLCVCGQSRRINRQGEPYGWPNNDFGRIDALFPIPKGEEMECGEGEEYLMDCIRSVGDFPEKAARRLIRAGGVS